MSTTTEHEWLRRLSDYHSGDIDAAEAEAVEEHLAGCEECREALRVYRRFYLLASSPLRLGEPSDALAEQLALTHDDSDHFMNGVRLGSRPSRYGSLSPERNRRLLGIASMLAASLIIVGFLAVLGPRIGSAGKHPTPSPSATPSAPTPTAQTTNLPVPGSGYINAGPDWATDLAFAPSSTSIVYACGIVASSSISLEILVAVSTDGGHTWQSRASPGSLSEKVPVPPLETDSPGFSQCTLTVDPDNSRDLALQGEACSDLVTTVTGNNSSGECKATTALLYRSVDGGAAWAMVNSPGGEWMVSHLLFTGQFVWVGSDLFVGTTEGIARSIAGGPFTLLQNAYFGTGPQAAEARQLFVIGNTLIVQDIQCSGEPGPHSCSGPTARSDDKGGHWTLTPMSYRSGVVSLFVVGADGKTLIGTDNSGSTYTPPGAYQYLRSIDGGATWSPLPSVPQTDVSTSGSPMAVAPDGTIYAWFSFFSVNSEGIGSNTIGIYELAPGALNWRYFAAAPGGLPRLFLWNNAGHLAVIWGERGSPHLSGFEYRLFSSK